MIQTILTSPAQTPLKHNHNHHNNHKHRHNQNTRKTRTAITTTNNTPPQLYTSTPPSTQPRSSAIPSTPTNHPFPGLGRIKIFFLLKTLPERDTLSFWLENKPIIWHTTNRWSSAVTLLVTNRACANSTTLHSPPPFYIAITF